MLQKTLFLGSILLLSTTLLNAQEIDRRESIEFGARAGFNVSNVWDSNSSEFTADRKMGFAGGLFLGIPIGKFLGVQPEVLISQKGFKGSGSLLGSPYSTSRTTTYIDVPLQVQLKPAEFISFVAGPQFSYLLKQKDEFTFGDNSSAQEQEFENDNIQKNVLGFVGGADVYYNHLVFSGRIGWDIQKNTGDGESLTPRYKNRWVQFTIGLKI